MIALVVFVSVVAVVIGVAWGAQSAFNDVNERLSFLNSPRGWHASTSRVLLEQIVAMLENDHAEEVANDHYGDESCSYCDWLRRAKQHLSRPMP